MVLLAGAPPDTFFTKGQNWRFPPLHPNVIRTRHYGYVLAYLRHQLARAGWLRIDHVMGLHRLFCIPQGFEAREGVYVHYPAEELYAITCLESHRHQTRIVGENLGTVPFAAFWKGLDLNDLLHLGLYDEAGKVMADQHRNALKRALARYVLKHDLSLADTEFADRDILEACLRYLAAGPAPLVIVNLEDLWGEETPQNVPGTDTVRPNWQRKAAFALETFRQLPQATETLRALRDLRPKTPIVRDKKIGHLHPSWHADARNRALTTTGCALFLTLSPMAGKNASEATSMVKFEVSSTRKSPSDSESLSSIHLGSRRDLLRDI